ncbi:hypothetical protein ABT294_18555 [Nonomuraea sp. NPDC000554]|uniref:hypothetical protein n=1 Tax=Nonomuraea sp. NPDC000554 TaxID=3154259 RepID=UPI00331D8F44
MATDLGDALTAYWRNGRWWGSDDFIRWLINHGHLSEAAFALDQVMQVPRLNKETRATLRRLERKLEERLREKPMLTPPVSRSAGPLEEPGRDG